MQPRALVSRLEPEICLVAARAVLALSLALAMAFTPHLFLRAMIGSLGMYAVTDGVFTALWSPRGAEHLARLEGALSLAFGIAIMLVGETQDGLLLVFSARNLLVSSIELRVAFKQSGGRPCFSPRAQGAYLVYAALAMAALACGFVLAGLMGHGALDLNVGLSVQLGLWSMLLLAHVRRLQQSRAPTSATPELAVRRHWV
jgi:uncharacterized membrane protein HdeD (DUF308 family)